MKKLQFTVIAILLSLAVISGQEQKDALSGSFSCKAKYAKGKDSYLLDSCRVDYMYKTILGDPIYFANMEWNRKNDFVLGKNKISYSQLADYPDLQKRFDLITPLYAKFKFTVLFYSNQSKAYIASAKSEIVVPLVEKAGSTVNLPIPTSALWAEMFTDVTVGKQNAKNPGVIIADRALEDLFKLERVTYGKLEKGVRGFSRSLRKVFGMSDRMDIVNVEMEVEWDSDDYSYIIDEYNRRENAAKALATKDTVKAEKIYFDNRTYLPTVGTYGKNFWSTTVAPYEVWVKAVEEADQLYSKQKWTEAKVYYQKAAIADPNFSYPARRMEKIQKYMDYKSSRNVGNLELIFVEGDASVKSFYIGKTEITQSQWRRVMGSNPSSFKGCFDCPVENVSWEEAQMFIKKLNEQTGMKYRLPRMDEWTFAADGGKKAVPSQFSGSDNIDEIAWCAYNSDESTHSVAKKAPNELGIYDMTGNVSEWVSDMYDKNTRFTKGGSWSDDAANSTLSANEKYDAKSKNNRIGFRVCQDE